MERPTVVIISDDPAFANAVTGRWLAERNVPSFARLGSPQIAQLRAGGFDLAVVGRVPSESLAPIFEALEAKSPAILVSGRNGHTPRHAGVRTLPETSDWPEILFVLAHQILENQHDLSELRRMREAYVELEHEASLGRYMLEMRHNLNNALTSILGNSDLILLDENPIPSTLRTQVETIRNMGMRMNEIMQRFSSLQKEMQLVEQQNWNNAAAKAAAAGQA